MGARIALELLRNPLDIAGMVLFEAPITDRADPEFAERLTRVRDVMEAEGNEAATILHSRLFHQRTSVEIEQLRHDREKWRLRVETFPITLREMEAVHRYCLFEPHNYQQPNFVVHLITGNATLPFLQQSAALISGLPFVQTQILQGHGHSAPSQDPAAVLAAFNKAMR